MTIPKTGLSDPGELAGLFASKADGFKTQSVVLVPGMDFNNG